MNCYTNTIPRVICVPVHQRINLISTNPYSLSKLVLVDGVKHGQRVVCSIIVTESIITQEITLKRFANTVIATSIEVTKSTRPHDPVHSTLPISDARDVHGKIKDAEM